MHEGVIRDVERQQRRKVENIYLLQQQIDFTREMREKQHETGADVTWEITS